MDDTAPTVTDLLHVDAPHRELLNELVDALLRWTDRQLPAVQEARARYDGAL